MRLCIGSITKKGISRSAVLIKDCSTTNLFGWLLADLDLELAELFTQRLAVGEQALQVILGLSDTHTDLQLLAQPRLSKK